MREQFRGYFPPTKDELVGLLRSAVVAFDANSLLNLYRFSEPTRAALLALIGSIRRRVWVPEQVVEEVLLNRPNVIVGELKRYADTRAQLGGLLDSLSSSFAHPFIQEELLEATKIHFALLQGQLSDREKELERTLIDDPVRDALAELLAGRVATRLDTGAKARIAQVGRERYDRKIPPGYKDGGKPEHERYGDLIIWHELQAHAKHERKDVIFTTDDQKEDWWLEVRGMTIGPRPELIQEFYRETKQRFYLLRTARFMELGREHLGVEIARSAIDEATHVKGGSESASRGGVSTENGVGLDRRYAVPKPSRNQLLRALQEFDTYFRDDPGWRRWRGRHKYAVEFSGRLYPVKKVISLAAGITTDLFSGGEQANRLLVDRGFTVVRLTDVAHEDLNVWGEVPDDPLSGESSASES